MLPFLHSLFPPPLYPATAPLNTTTRRFFLHPLSCSSLSSPCQFCPASTQWSLPNNFAINFFTFELCFSLNTYARPRCSAPSIARSVPQLQSPRTNRG